MKFAREWAMPSHNTFQITPINTLLKRYVKKEEKWIDPFANTSKLASITNDLNPEHNADYCMDAVDFLKMFESESIDGVLYDPPYSLRQVSECYKNVGKEVTMETTQSSWRRNHLDEISRVTKLGGKLICFGWNSSGAGIKRGFEIQEILLVPHGGSHNDTIVTVEVKKHAMTNLFGG